MLIKYSRILVLCVVFVACENRSEVEALLAETERIHDEAMSQIGPANALARQLKTRMENLDSLSPRYDQLRQARGLLYRANDDMNTWMAEYEEPTNQTPKAEAIRYLQDQKAKMEQNRGDILHAISNAQKLLAE
jgi:hypothetical protein